MPVLDSETWRRSVLPYSLLLEAHIDIADVIIALITHRIGSDVALSVSAVEKRACGTLTYGIQHLKSNSRPCVPPWL